ncbi:MAG: type VI secretion system tip protein VgrG [Acidobacteria bacterium]|nr:type VI secretion system tip protein VgrG [Acidobacteriota bacterium]
MPFTQAGRIIKIDTPLGEDVLLLRSFTGQEGLSRLFSFDLDLLSEVNSAINPRDILGQRVTITVNLPGNQERYINGHVSHFVQSGRDPRFTYYHARVVPWLWFLGRTAGCRMFQNKTISEIITQVFSDMGFSDYLVTLEGSESPREYCVQYRETSLNFVSRLMEQYGLFYFFEHEQDKHTLVIADSTGAHESCPNQDQVRFTQLLAALEDEDSISEFAVQYDLRSGRFSLADYNFETPTTSLYATVSSTIQVGDNDRLELYDYPGEYLTQSDGDDLVHMRMEEEEAAHVVGRGASNCRAFISGYKFNLTDHYRDDWNQEWVISEVNHAASVGGHYHGEQGGEPENYTNTFACFPSSVPFRPLRITPRPVVQGPQTAVVVGKAGEEIWVDQYGRVKVQFHWDRESQANETSSCWIRVSQLWAGKNWGAMWIPRIGQEVIVDFLEGDPDQPIITGRVYNAVEMPPYELPGEQTKSTIKSYSSKGGGGFNEIRFEDKKGSEQVFIHAQNRQDNRVRGNSYETVGGERHLVIHKDQWEHVKGDRYQHIEGDNFKVIDGELMQLVKGDWGEKTDGRYVAAAGKKMTLRAGQNLCIHSDDSVTLRGPGGFIQIDSSGVTIQGTQVKINSGGTAKIALSVSITPGEDAKEADTAKPGQASQPPPRPRATTQSPAAQAMREAAQNGTPFCPI